MELATCPCPCSDPNPATLALARSIAEAYGRKLDALGNPPKLWRDVARRLFGGRPLSEEHLAELLWEAERAEDKWITNSPPWGPDLLEQYPKQAEKCRRAAHELRHLFNLPEAAA